MQRFLRPIGICSAILFCLLMLNSRPVKADNGTDAIIHPGGCIDIRSVENDDGSAPVCCGFGYVYDGATGQPLDDVTVTVQSQNKRITVATQLEGVTKAPHYSANLSEGLKIKPGDTITLTATYNGVTVTKQHRVDSGGQQIDLVVPTAQSDLPPIATVGYIHNDDNAIQLLGDGGDRDNLGTAEMRYRWTSNIQGPLSEEAHFTLYLADLSPGNHLLSLEVQDDEGNWSEPATRPLSHMVYDFAEGWHALNLAALPHDINDARMLMEAVAAQGGCPEGIAWWSGDGWAPIPYDDYILQEELAIQLWNGWNFITYPNIASPMPAQMACQQINQQGGSAADIARWDASVGDWSSHECDSPFEGFELEPGGDYFIHNQSSNTWEPQPVIVAAQAAPQATSGQEGVTEIQSISLVTPKPKITNKRITKRGIA